MYNNAFVLLGLSCLGHACYGQSSVSTSGSSRRSLANLLLTSDPSNAFNPSMTVPASTAMRRIGNPAPATSTALHRISRRAPATNMFFSKAEEQEEVAPVSDTLIGRLTEDEISDELQQTLNDAIWLIARLSAAAVMIHHGQEKILSPELFTKFTIDKYFAFLPGPHIFYAYAAGYVQFLAPILLGLGVFSRLAGASLVAVMLGAVYYSLVNVGLEGFPFFELQGLSAKLKFGVPAFHNYGFETPVLYVAIFALAAVNGPGKFSIAQLLGWNDDKSLLGKLKQ